LWCCVSFLVAAGNSFWCYVHIQCTIQLCCCVGFLVVVGHSSQNENMFLRKTKIWLLYYDLLANVCILYDLILFHSVSFIYFFGAATAFYILGTDNAE
jgi:hypothetical protein